MIIWTQMKNTTPTLVSANWKDASSEDVVKFQNRKTSEQTISNIPPNL